MTKTVEQLFGIENNNLAINDKMDYYPCGCYDIPLNLMDELRLSGNNYHSCNLKENV